MSKRRKPTNPATSPASDITVVPVEGGLTVDTGARLAVDSPIVATLFVDPPTVDIGIEARPPEVAPLVGTEAEWRSVAVLDSEAYREGKAAHDEGLTRNPYDEGTPEHAEWSVGWDDARRIADRGRLEQLAADLNAAQDAISGPNRIPDAVTGEELVRRISEGERAGVEVVELQPGNASPVGPETGAVPACHACEGEHHEGHICDECMTVADAAGNRIPLPPAEDGGTAPSLQFESDPGTAPRATVDVMTFGVRTLHTVPAVEPLTCPTCTAEVYWSCWGDEGTAHCSESNRASRVGPADWKPACDWHGFVHRGEDGVVRIGEAPGRARAMPEAPSITSDYDASIVGLPEPFPVWGLPIAGPAPLATPDLTYIADAEVVSNLTLHQSNDYTVTFPNGETVSYVDGRVARPDPTPSELLSLYRRIAAEQTKIAVWSGTSMLSAGGRELGHVFRVSGEMWGARFGGRDRCKDGGEAEARGWVEEVATAMGWAIVRSPGNVK